MSEHVSSFKAGSFKFILQTPREAKPEKKIVRENMSEVKCPYKVKCLDFPYQCDRCAHNQGKAHHFKPIN